MKMTKYKKRTSKVRTVSKMKMATKIGKKIENWSDVDPTHP